MPDWLDPLLTHAEAPPPAVIGDRRTAILQAALTVLTREGITRFSMRRVAREAGVALGLVNYHFKTKEALLAAVTVAAPRPDGGADLSATQDPTLAQALCARARARLDALRLRVDLEGQALRDPLVARAVAQAQDVRDELLASRVRVGSDSSEEARALAALLAAAIDGLVLRAAIDPDFDPSSACRALDDLLQSRMAEASG